MQSAADHHGFELVAVIDADAGCIFDLDDALYAEVLRRFRAEIPKAKLIAGKPMKKRFVCRTFSECTTAPRNGLISGSYPLDEFYKQRPEFAQLKEIKKKVGA